MPPDDHHHRRTAIRAVFFDVDGVLVDSLPQHLQVCRDLSRQYNLRLQIPDVPGFKALARSGVQVSPMRCFFTAVGFPDADAERADRYYQEHFADRYPTPLFAGVHDMLHQLIAIGLPLGLVTANTRRYAQRALGPEWSHFHPACRFADDDPGRLSKADALRAGAAALDLDVTAVAFVGDQPSDRRAAVDAGVGFIGVTYGWALSATDTGFVKADRPGGIIDVLGSIEPA